MSGFLLEGSDPLRMHWEMAEEGMRALGLEPRTYGLKARCSTN